MNPSIKISIVLMALFLTACGTTPLSLNYSPSSTVVVPHADIAVGNFRYLPGEGDKVKPNQIRNTALGSIVIDQNVADFFESAVQIESRFVGLNLDDSAPRITGEIIEFLIDDLGFSVDWTLDVRYMIEECYDKSHQILKKTDKFGDVFGTLNGVIRDNIELALTDPLFQSCLSPGDNATGLDERVMLIQDTVASQPSASEVPGSLNSDVSNLEPATTQFPQLVSDLRSGNTLKMRNAAKRIGEEAIQVDQGVVAASIVVLTGALTTGVDNKDRMLKDGLAWSAINLGNSGDDSVSAILGRVVGSDLPKKVRNAAIHALQTLNENK